MRESLQVLLATCCGGGVEGVIKVCEGHATLRASGPRNNLTDPRGDQKQTPGETQTGGQIQTQEGRKTIKLALQPQRTKPTPGRTGKQSKMVENNT